MNKTIKDEPFITRYCDWDYFRKHYPLMEDYEIWNIYPENTLLEVNFWDYDVEVHWILKEALEEERERHEWERYSFNCFNKKNEHKPVDEERETN